MRHNRGITLTAALMVAVLCAALNDSSNTQNTQSNTANPQANAEAQTNAAHKVPEISANLGTCYVEIRVIDSAGKPVYGAQVSVHMRYGFGGFHRMDLQVGTNVDGLARFTGLTDRARMPLEFHATYQGREAVVPVDLRSNCHQKQDAKLPDKPTPPQEGSTPQ